MAVMHLFIVDASSHIIWCGYIYPSGVSYIFPKFKMVATTILDFHFLSVFGHSCVLIVWYLCSVPNLFQIYVIVTEIDAHMLQTFS